MLPSKELYSVLAHADLDEELHDLEDESEDDDDNDDFIDIDDGGSVDPWDDPDADENEESEN